MAGERLGADGGERQPEYFDEKSSRVYVHWFYFIVKLYRMVHSDSGAYLNKLVNDRGHRLAGIRAYKPAHRFKLIPAKKREQFDKYYTRVTIQRRVLLNDIQ